MRFKGEDLHYGDVVSLRLRDKEVECAIVAAEELKGTIIVMGEGIACHSLRRLTERDVVRLAIKKRGPTAVLQQSGDVEHNQIVPVITRGERESARIIAAHGRLLCYRTTDGILLVGGHEDVGHDCTLKKY